MTTSSGACTVIVIKGLIGVVSRDYYEHNVSINAVAEISELLLPRLEHIHTHVYNNIGGAAGQVFANR
jgi:hypothetical protein